jgi:acetyl-CoA carboxylase beta subunit
MTEQQKLNKKEYLKQYRSQKTECPNCQKLVDKSNIQKHIKTCKNNQPNMEYEFMKKMNELNDMLNKYKLNTFRIWNKNIRKVNLEFLDLIEYNKNTYGITYNHLFTYRLWRLNINIVNHEFIKNLNN